MHDVVFLLPQNSVVERNQQGVGGEAAEQYHKKNIILQEHAYVGPGLTPFHYR